MPSKPDYGLDAPGVVRTLILIGVILLPFGRLVPSFRIGSVTFVLGSASVVTGSLLILEGLLMILYSKWGKFRHCDRMLKRIAWHGTETVLDVGTGRGLLLIAAAKHLTTGKSVGIDIWSSKDLSGNTMEGTLRNAELEGVRERVDVQNGDATAMRFPDATFDVILSNACIHNIPGRKARDKACREIVRVLKPGGVALVSDFIHTADYVKACRAAGATAIRTGMNFLFTFPRMRVVEVRKPAP
ncbi:MAG TPA: class I SAM-dependent methyltransferase [Terriglobales bacterium]|nr:class I SAM-dependent methyltransferase [Terriglobales bacterium]